MHCQEVAEDRMTIINIASSILACGGSIYVDYVLAFVLKHLCLV
jgi:hypothetical protein